MTLPRSPEINLDPHDWNATRSLAHRMIDDIFDQVMTVRERPVWSGVPEDVKERLIAAPLPRAGEALEQVYKQFLQDILPYPTGNQHPRFFGWVMGNGTITGMLADMLASSMNPHLAGYNQSASLVEKQVIQWLAELLGFPVDSSGILVSGGSMANLNAILVARNEIVDYDIRELGLSHPHAPRLTIYGSSETHNWIYKACETMGMGRRAFRAIPCDVEHRLDLNATRLAITQDIEAGYTPFCLIATAGTVATGAIDDLQAMRKLADEFGLWLHVDGAFGSLAALSPRDAHLVKGQELADSVAFDLHKWGYMPFEVACVLVRHAKAQTQTFGSEAGYLNSLERGLTVGITWFADRGLQLTRGFRALKVWMSLKEQGVDRIGAVIQQNIDLARELDRLVQDHPHLESLAPVPLNIVCLRYRPRSLELAEAELDVHLNELNRALLTNVQESGIAMPSQAIINGKFAIRVCISNHRTQRSDLDVLIEAIETEGQRLVSERG